MLTLIACFFIYGLLFGVLISSCYFARKSGNVVNIPDNIQKKIDENDKKIANLLCFRV